MSPVKDPFTVLTMMNIVSPLSYRRFVENGDLPVPPKDYLNKSLLLSQKSICLLQHLADIRIALSSLGIRPRGA
jgi:hypothetical protein